MKQMIVLVSMIMLGIFIFELIAGNGDNTVMSALGELWEEGLDARNYYGI